MAAIQQTLQGLLPLELFERLRRLRTRYRAALRAAAKGDYSYARELRTVSAQVGRILAAEARREPETRGGLPMLEILLVADRLFPELRGWNQHEVLQRSRERMSVPQGSVPRKAV